LRNLTHSAVGITSYMNQKHLVCVSSLSITIHPRNLCCYHCATLTSPCICI